MNTKMDDLKRLIAKDNEILQSNDPVFPEADAHRYIENYKKLFLLISDLVKNTKNIDGQETLIKELCDLNYLPAIQLKLGVKLTPEINELAYDFDNPDYPGVDNVAKKMLDNGYALQTKR